MPTQEPSPEARFSRRDLYPRGGDTFKDESVIDITDEAQAQRGIRELMRDITGATIEEHVGAVATHGMPKAEGLPQTPTTHTEPQRGRRIPRNSLTDFRRRVTEEDVASEPAELDLDDPLLMAPDPKEQEERRRFFSKKQSAQLGGVTKNSVPKERGFRVWLRDKTFERPKRLHRAFAAIGLVAIASLLPFGTQGGSHHDAQQVREPAVAMAPETVVSTAPATTIAEIPSTPTIELLQSIEEQEAFNRLCNWIEQNPGVDFADALNNFYS